MLAGGVSGWDKFCSEICKRRDPAGQEKPISAWTYHVSRLSWLMEFGKVPFKLNDLTQLEWYCLAVYNEERTVCTEKAKADAWKKK